MCRCKHIFDFCMPPGLGNWSMQNPVAYTNWYSICVRSGQDSPYVGKGQYQYQGWEVPNWTSFNRSAVVTWEPRPLREQSYRETDRQIQLETLPSRNCKPIASATWRIIGACFGIYCSVCVFPKSNLVKGLKWNLEVSVKFQGGWKVGGLKTVEGHSGKCKTLIWFKWAVLSSSLCSHGSITPRKSDCETRGPFIERNIT